MKKDGFVTDVPERIEYTMINRMKKLLSLLLITSFILTISLGLLNITALAAFNVGSAVETEVGILANGMTVYNSQSAGGGQCISITSGSAMTTPQNLAQSDARYSFNIPTSGNYIVYLRTYAATTSNDQFWYRWSSIASTYTQRYATTGSGWQWTQTDARTLAAGVHTLDICHRENSLYIDMIVVAQVLTAGQKASIEAAIGSQSTAVNYNTAGGAVVLEAENTTLNPTAFSALSDNQASGGSAIAAGIDQVSVPDRTLRGAEFHITPDRSAKYYFWVRYSGVSGQNSLYYSMGDSAYTQKILTATAASEYGWMQLAVTSEILLSGVKYNLKLYPAKAGLRIDQVVATTYPFYSPQGIATDFNTAAYGYTLPDNAFPMPTITPSANHPRLNFRESDISTIKANMTKSQNASALSQYNSYLSKNVDGLLAPPPVEGLTNYNGSVLANLESYALKYALDGDTAYGNKAIAAIKNYLNTIVFSHDELKGRNMGHVLYVASEVYDWCYPLLTAEDKNYIITAGEGIASRMDPGWPPTKLGGVTGWGGESLIFRDMFSFAIATYNERPDIYNFVAGRLLNQHIEPRNYWFASGTHNQGDSYGHSRHNWELVFQWILYRMSGVKIFTEDAGKIPYQWMYMRRPDGQYFRSGDSYQAEGAVVGNYWTGDREPAFFSSNFYNNSYVKNLYFISNPTNAYGTTNTTLTPVGFLLFNNPDLQVISHTDTFPLTRYFPSPNGTMIARTGWVQPGTVNLSSNIAMAQMVIGEQWAANHQHLDAGSFQLYYKGGLAIDTGVYDEYGSAHDSNYHKETIAHNSLLIHDPSEGTGGRANSGGQRRSGGEMATFQQWMAAGYDTGKVLDQGFDAVSAVPSYSYIKGDITRAYTTKVSEVLRSMLFLPLQDAQHPAALIVMDKITSANPAFKKTWLLHSQQEPIISGNTAMIKRDTDGYNGRMDLTTLLPTNPVLTKIGGAGKEFSINGINYAPGQMGKNGTEAGAWRIEASPSSTNTTDYFLNVMQVSDASANAVPLATTLIETNALAGAKLANQVVVFGKGKQRLEGPISFAVPGSEGSGLKLKVAGVAQGSWNVYKDMTFVGTVVATAEGGIISFEGGAGEYSLLHMDTNLSNGLLSLSYEGGGNLLGTGQTEFHITLLDGTITPPVVAAQALDPMASIAINQATEIPGTATVTVTSADGLSNKTYMVHFTKAEVGNPTLAQISYTHNYRTKQVELSAGDGNRYKAYLPYGTTVMPYVSAIPSYAGANVTVEQPTAFPGDAKITVTAADGSQTKTYYLRFTYPAGTVTNLTNNLSTKTYVVYSDMRPQSLPELRQLYGDVGANWAAYCKPYMDRTFTTVSDTQGSSFIPADPSLTRLPGGETWFMYWIARDTIKGNTSSYFHGSSWIATSNTDCRSDTISPYLAELHPDAITFNIDRPATIWVAFNGSTTYPNFTNNGWVRVNDTDGYKLMQGDGNAFSYFYKKDFAAGRVEIPTTGQALNRGFIPVIMWVDNKVDPEVTVWPAVHTLTYGQTFSQAISGGEGDGNFVISDADVIPQASVVPYTKTITFIPNDDLNYNILTREVLVTVEPDAQKGDINNDGNIDISDVILAAEISVGYANYSATQRARANVSSNADSTVDIADVVLLMERIMGSTDPFPAEVE